MKVTSNESTKQLVLEVTILLTLYLCSDMSNFKHVFVAFNGTSSTAIIVSSSISSIPVATYTHSTTTSLNSPTAPSAASDDSNSFSVGVIVAIVVIVAVIFIIITINVLGIVAELKGKKTKEHTKPEGVYYSTIDKTSLPRSPMNKPEPIYSEMNDGLNNKEPHYMEINNKVHFIKQPDKDNPAYSVLSEHQVQLQDNPAYCTSSGKQVEMQDNPAYSISPGHNA